MAEQDLREDQMTIANSVDYLRGLKGKDSVLIGLTKVLFLSFNKGYISANTDCDNLTDTGCYALNWGSNVGNTNFPDNNYLYGILLVFSSSGSPCIQIIHNTANKLFVRIRYDGIWKPWKSITLT